MAKYTKNDIEIIELAFELVNKKFERLLNAVEGFHKKLNIALGFSVIAIFQLLIIGIEHEYFIKKGYIIGFFLIIIAFIIMILSIRLKDMLDPADFKTFYSEETFKNPAIETKNQIIADTKKCYNSINKQLTCETNKFNNAIYIFLVGAILVLFSFINFHQLWQNLQSQIQGVVHTSEETQNLQIQQVMLEQGHQVAE